jgi:succinate-semialdehyde dehydrogenase/glutarate-semialdehyde dehydrogenase
MVSLSDGTSAIGSRVRSILGGYGGGDADRSIPVEEPFSGDEMGSVPAESPSDVRAAFERAREAQPAWAETSRTERARVLGEFHDLVLAARDELLDLLQREAGKARLDAYEEVLDVAQTTDYYASNVEDYLAPQREAGAIPLLTKAVHHRHPVGVVGVISPWNYPLTLSVSDAVPALLAGNAVVVKPAEETPFTALAMADLLAEAGLPEDVFQVVTGYGDELGPPLVEESDYVTFTGSTETGRIVAEQAATSLTDCSLELGGKNPMLVLDDADLAAATAGAVKGSFANAGQLCISFERIYVDESVYEEFLDRFLARTEALDLGATVGYGYDVGSLASGDQLRKVQSHVEDARDRGATVRTGGDHRPDVGPYVFEPTVVTDLPDEAVAACEETFGPVVSVEPVDGEEAAVAAANDSEYGLNAAVYTGDRDRGEALATRIECGTVGVNDPYVASWASTGAPMGGMKQSGIGRRHGAEGIEKYTESQTVALQRGPQLRKPDWLPGRAYVEGFTRFAKLLERIPGLR